MNSTSNGARTLARWLLSAEWRSHPGRAAVAIVTIALGVALGYAVQLINSAAFNEFSAATKSLSGQADLQVRGAQPTFDEAWYPRLSAEPGVALASPVLDLDVTVPDQSTSLKVLGIDVFKASRITPELVGVPQPDHAADTFADNTIFLSPAAQTWLDTSVGKVVALRNGTALVPLRVAGALVASRPGQRLAIMDIAAAQWRFGLIGRLSRIDLQLERGIDRERFKRDLQKRLGPGLVIGETQDDASRTDRLSRAYRINMNVLALVALFTGAFLVFSTQALGVVRRRSQFAMLRVLGFTRRRLLSQVLMEGAVLGVLGSVLGLVIGYGMASVALRFFGSDLGGGYFPGVHPRVGFEPIATAIFLALGTGVAILGSLAPALEAARARPAAALKAGSEEGALARLSSPWPALLSLSVAVILTLLPPLFDVPILGYLSVALMLIGGIALMPRCTALLFSSLGRWRAGSRRSATATLALARLANAPGQASIAMGGVLSSFALIVAMAIMVSSFRVSVDEWLGHLLSADLYVRVSPNGNTGGWRPGEQALLAAVPGVAHAAFQRTSSITLDPARPAVAVLGREIDCSRSWRESADDRPGPAAVGVASGRHANVGIGGNGRSLRLQDRTTNQFADRNIEPHVRRGRHLARLRASDGRDPVASRGLSATHRGHDRHRRRHNRRARSERRRSDIGDAKIALRRCNGIRPTHADPCKNADYLRSQLRRDLSAGSGRHRDWLVRRGRDVFSAGARARA